MPTVAEPELPADEAAPAARSRAGRTLRWLGGSVLLALAGWTAVGLADYTVGRFDEDLPAPPVQLAAMIGRAAGSGLHVVENRTVDFQGTDSPARVVVLRPDRGSDELRIFDVRGERLVSALRFQPVPVAGSGVRIRIVDAQDLDDNGSQELVAALTVPAVDSTGDAPHVVRHVLVGVWDWLRGDYRLLPLLGTPAGARPAPLRVGRVAGLDPEERTRRAAYTTAVRIDDRVARRPFTSHGVEGFRIRKTSAGAFLDAWFMLQRPSGVGVGGGVAIGANGEQIVGKPSFHTTRRGVMHVRVWRIRPWRLDAPLYPCDGAGAIVRFGVVVDPDALFRRTVARDVAPFCA